MVALSVSTSANKSPDFTLSPTFLCHSTITPSVIVSLIRGMRITSAIINNFNCFKMEAEINAKKGNICPIVAPESIYSF